MKHEMPKLITIISLLLLLLLAYPTKCASLSASNSNAYTFVGKSSSQITVPLSVHPLSHHFPEWLSSNHSHHHLLGTNDVIWRGDGMYHCNLPSLSFFGLKIKPSCVSIVEQEDPETITKQAEVNSSSSTSDDFKHILLATNKDITEKERVCLKVTIQESVLQVDSSSESMGTVLESITELCKLHGGNRITCTKQQDSWILSSDLELHLHLFLGTNSNGKPKFLPPGFRSIGERILRKTCEKRVQDNLNRIKAGFEDYLVQLQESEEKALMSPFMPPK